MLVLLFPARLPQQDFAGFDAAAEGVEPLPAADANAGLGQLDEVQAALLGKEYFRSRRITRSPIGRVRFAPPRDDAGPDHADVFLVTHIAGAAGWECWIPIPDQPLDAARYVGWLQSSIDGSPAALLRERIAAASQRIAPPANIEDGFPFTMLRHAGNDPP